MDIARVFLFHFTHIDNIPSIISHGLHCDANLSKYAYVNSGDMDIKARRLAKPVPFAGFVGDYVPFYFAPRSPMLYRQHINNLVNQEHIVYLCTTAERIMTAGHNWCCTDINAAKSLANFYNTAEEMLLNINWDYMHDQYWNDTDEHPNRKGCRMAEFLVHGSVPWVDFSAACVYDDVKEAQLQSLLPQNSHIRTAVRRNWYF